MSFGGGFATGIAAGIGSGLAMGISSGKEQAAKGIREHVDRNGITILDRQGKPIKLDQFLDAAVGQKRCQKGASSSTRAWLVLLIALLVLGVAAAVSIYFYAAN